MAKTRTRPYDTARYLGTAEEMAAYLQAALDLGDPALVAAALGDIARAKGMAQLARETGLGRESLYKALSASGNPEFATVLKVARALGILLSADVARGNGPGNRRARRQKPSATPKAGVRSPPHPEVAGS